MADIKTKEVLKGTIKTFDKASIVTDKTKCNMIATKDNAEKSTSTKEHSAEEYSINRLEESMSVVTRKSVTTLNHIRKNNGNNRSEIRKNMPRNIHEATIRTKQGNQSFKIKRASDSRVKQNIKSMKTSLNTLERTKQSFYLPNLSARKIGIKQGEKRIVKKSSQAIKTAKSTSKIAIKTTEQSSKTIKTTTKATAKAAQKTFQTGRLLAMHAYRATKVATIATIKASKAILAGTKALLTAIIAGGWVSVIVIIICVLLGAAISLFGDDSESSGYIAVSSEVEAYTPMITKYAKEYGIPEYVELIKAVMMQESGGRGNDPMQASEGGFNTMYPREPNAIQNPEYSISCGVQELKAALESAGVENPVDMERINLALQGYNFGNGYISWAIENYGGYSYANAVEFSSKQAEKLGWERYGDTQYVSHVLRYYPYGRAFTSRSNTMIVEVALAELGNVGGEPYWSWYGFNSRVEWCACFVSWCAEQLGYIESGIIPKYASCNAGASWFKERSQWADRNIEPTAGMIIFFDWDGDGSLDHTGLVEKCENGTVYTIEGNSGDECRERTYAVGSEVIAGYGVPNY